MNFSTCCNVLPLTCSIRWLVFLESHNSLVFLVLLFRLGRTQQKTNEVHVEGLVEKTPKRPQENKRLILQLLIAALSLP